jgi:glycosyltransferase involved in cell wall biosynthesis
MSGADDFESPWDFLARSQSPLHPLFRRLDAAIDPPPGLPFGFTLGPPLAPGNDWTIFAEEANARGRVESDHRVLIVYEPATEQDATDFVASLDNQIFAGRITLSLHGPAATGRHVLRDGTNVRLHRSPFWNRSLREAARRGADEADTVILLSGRCIFDPLALERICRMTRLSRLIVVPLAEASARPARAVSIPATVADWPGVAPYRAVRGLNLALPSALARLVGPLARGSAGAGPAGRDYAFRCHERGAYFVPVFVPELVSHGTAGGPALGIEVNAVDRLRRPRASLIVSTGLDTAAARATISHLLAGAGRDCEICVWGTGPRLPLLALTWRFTRAANIRIIRAETLDGAIASTRGPYVGLLEAGDNPNADLVQEAITRLEMESEVVATQQNDIEADARRGWGRPSAEELLVAPDPGGFIMVRRSAWARARGARLASDAPADLFREMSGIGLVEVQKGPSKRSRRKSRRTQEHHTEVAQRVDRELTRRGLDRYWVPVQAGPSAPDQARVARNGASRLVIFWPDYSRDNPYQRLLYGPARTDTEYVSGNVDAAIRAAQSLGNTGVVFHIHWANRIFRPREDESIVRAKAVAFLDRVGEFKRLGGMVAWTIHNIVTHDSRHRTLEIEFSRDLVALADRIHIHASRSLPEIEAHFQIPPEKVRIVPHGLHTSVYADLVTQAQARLELGLSDADDVLLFTGRLRPYKGLADLVSAFRRLLPSKPGLKLILAGEAKAGEGRAVLEGLSGVERSRVLMVDRFLENDEMQLFLRAADAGVYPYDEILTSGSILLALTFGLPCIAPRFGMISETVEGEGGPAGILYDKNQPAGLEDAILRLLDVKRAGGLEPLRRAVQRTAGRIGWLPFAGTILGP